MANSWFETVAEAQRRAKKPDDLVVPDGFGWRLGITDQATSTPGLHASGSC